MKYIISLFCSFMLFIILTGCASSSQYARRIDRSMSSWVGHHQSELIRQNGPPDRETNDGLGGKILTYINRQYMGQVPGNIEDNPFGGTSYTSPVVLQGSTTMNYYVDSEGIIYYYRFTTNVDAISNYKKNMVGIYFFLAFLALIAYNAGY